MTLITLSLTVKKTLRTYNDDKFNPRNPNPPDPNHPIPNSQGNAKDMITMINSIQSDPNPPDPNNHPIPNRQEDANAVHSVP